MRKIIITCLLLLVSFTVSARIYTNQIDLLVGEHLQACGGENALWNLQSISRHGSITFYNQNPGKPIDTYNYTTHLVYPSQLREQLNTDVTLVDRGTDGINYWAWDGNQYAAVGDEYLITYLKETAEQANRELLFIKQNLSQLQYLNEVPNWAPAQSQCIQGVRAKDGKALTYCFNTTTHLVNAIGEANEYRLLQNYRHVSSIMLPFHLVHYKNGLIVYEIQLEQAELDQPMPQDLFNMPRLAAAISQS